MSSSKGTGKIQAIYLENLIQLTITPLEQANVVDREPTVYQFMIIYKTNSIRNCIVMIDPWKVVNSDQKICMC